MSSDFDPYRVWLSIPVEEQPANYYRLLGVELFESDDEVISSAAERQMAHVRSFQSGQYSEQAQKLLNELAHAQVTLLNKTRKVKYDAQLRLKIKSSSDPKIDDTIVVELPPPPPLPIQQNKSKIHQKKKSAAKTVKKNSGASITSYVVILLSAMILELLLFLGFFLFYRSKQPTAGDMILAKAERLYSQAVKLEKENNYSEALNKIITACELTPENEDYESTRQRIKALYEESLVAPGTKKTFAVNGVEFAFRWCPSGSFMMGSPESEEGRKKDETQHQVTLTKGFWMMETEVTQQQWKAIMESIPECREKGDNLPVEQISWNDCQEFCKKCAELGFPVQLPTEAQWEYACRAGTTEAHVGSMDEMAWYNSNSGYKTHPGGLKKPNAWGLYDMHGNVWEWCNDWYDAEYPSDSVIDPMGPSSGSNRVRRGGAWGNDLASCRSAYRLYNLPEYHFFNLGFRCVLSSDYESKLSKTEEPASTGEKEELVNQNNNEDDKKAGMREVITVKGVEFAFRWCPPGTFMMGSPESEEGRYKNETQRKVTLAKGFWMLETEVTQKQWEAIMDYNNSHFKGDKNHPVEHVCWDECQTFCIKCKELGLPVTLPSEEQWEYACRAGSTTAYFWGNALNGDKANCNGNNPCGTTTTGKNIGSTTSVGSYEPNAWGLYDMHGNVYEWCQDSYTDSLSPSDMNRRVLRGGTWNNKARNCRSAFRQGCYHGLMIGFIGFRVIKDE